MTLSHKEAVQAEDHQVHLVLDLVLRDQVIQVVHLVHRDRATHLPLAHQDLVILVQAIQDHHHVLLDHQLDQVIQDQLVLTVHQLDQAIQDQLVQRVHQLVQATQAQHVQQVLLLDLAIQAQHVQQVHQLVMNQHTLHHLAQMDQQLVQ